MDVIFKKVNNEWEMISRDGAYLGRAEVLEVEGATIVDEDRVEGRPVAVWGVQFPDEVLRNRKLMVSLGFNRVFRYQGEETPVTAIGVFITRAILRPTGIVAVSQD